MGNIFGSAHQISVLNIGGKIGGTEMIKIDSEL